MWCSKLCYTRLSALKPNFLIFPAHFIYISGYFFFFSNRVMFKVMLHESRWSLYICSTLSVYPLPICLFLSVSGYHFPHARLSSRSIRLSTSPALSIVYPILSLICFGPSASHLSFLRLSICIYYILPPYPSLSISVCQWPLMFGGHKTVSILHQPFLINLSLCLSLSTNARKPSHLIYLLSAVCYLSIYLSINVRKSLLRIYLVSGDSYLPIYPVCLSVCPSV